MVVVLVDYWFNGEYYVFLQYGVFFGVVVMQYLWFFMYFLIDVVIVIFFDYVIVMFFYLVLNSVVNIVQCCVRFYYFNVFLYCFIGSFYQLVGQWGDIVYQVYFIGVGNYVCFFEGDIDVNNYFGVQMFGCFGDFVVYYIVNGSV